MQRLFSIVLLVIVCAAATTAGQQRQVRGQVVNRDGAPQRCQVDFYAATGAEPVYRSTSDGQGYFYLNNPKPGAYRVVVVQGSRQDEFKRVTIDDTRLNPSTLVVQKW